MGGEVEEIKHAYIFDNIDFVFKDFINKFSSMRIEGVYENIIGKNIINSFYGSTALNNRDVFTYISYSKNE
jgi:hypothetical protein